MRRRGAKKLPQSTPLLATFIERSSPKRLAGRARFWSEVRKSFEKGGVYKPTPKVYQFEVDRATGPVAILECPELALKR